MIDCYNNGSNEWCSPVSTSLAVWPETPPTKQNLFPQHVSASWAPDFLGPRECGKAIVCDFQGQAWKCLAACGEAPSRADTKHQSSEWGHPWMPQPDFTNQHSEDMWMSPANARGARGFPSWVQSCHPTIHSKKLVLPHVSGRCSVWWAVMFLVQNS